MLEGAVEGTVIYIAGPMTGYENFNYESFNAVEKQLRRGGYYKINNPASHYGGRQDLSWELYLTAALHTVMDSEAIIALPGWMDSPGARLEIAVATAMGHVTYSAIAEPDGGYRFVRRDIGDAKGMVAALLGMGRHPLIPSQTSQTQQTQMPHEEAAFLVHGDRQADYGHPYDNYKRLSLVWTGLLDDRLKTHEVITPEDCTMMLAAMKLVRQMNHPKRDNIVDTHGYLMVHDMIGEERVRRAQG